MLRISLSRQIHLPHHQVDGVSAIYINSALRYLAVSLVQIFVPLYIIRLTGSLAAVFVYYIYVRGLEVLLVPLIGVWVARLGFRRSVFFSNILLCFYLFSLVKAADNFSYLIISATLLPVLTLFYWLSYHSIFTLDHIKKMISRQVAWLRLISRLSMALGPIAGGFVIVLFGFRGLYSLAIVIIIASSLPLFLMSHHRHDPDIDFLRLFGSIFQSSFRRYFWAFLGVGIEDTVFTYLWPVFIFWRLKDYEVLGGITGISLALAVFGLYLAGRVVRQRQKVLFRWGLVLAAGVWLLKIMARTALSFLALDTVYNLAGILIWIPFDSKMYARAARSQPFLFLLKRSLSVNLGRSLGFILAAVMFLLGPGWLGVFLLGGASLGLMRMMLD